MTTEHNEQQGYIVPPDTTARVCKVCGEDMSWISDANNRRVPVDCRAPHGTPPTRTKSGYGRNHFRACNETQARTGARRYAVR